MRIAVLSGTGMSDLALEMSNNASRNSEIRVDSQWGQVPTILVETGLVPGVLLRNKYLEFICKNVFVKINDKKNKYFKNVNNEVLEFHIAHNEGNYFCTNDQLKEIEDNNQIAINYCDENGKIEDQFNPNGSIKNIAGIFNKEKNVLGMMPHPERMIDTSLSGEDGSLFFKNLINNLK